MDIVVKAVVALCVGFCLMAGLQMYGLFSIKQYLMSDAAKRSASTALPVMKPAFNLDTSKMGSVIPKMPPIDTKAGERAALNSINRQIDLTIRAGNAVPGPSFRHMHGMR